MNLKGTIFILLSAVVLMDSVCANSASLEDQYFATRDSYIQKFAATTSDSFTDNQNALAILEQKIKTIIGPVNIEGFGGKGQINLETLNDELGFGKLDGVLFTSAGASLVVTNSRILNRYLSDGKYIAKNIAALAADEGFYSVALSSDAAVSLYTQIPVIKNNSDSVYAYLGLIAQDIGPFLPDRIFVIAKRGERVFFVTVLVSNPAPEIEACKKNWFESAKKDEDAAYSAYQECYGKNIREMEFYKDISKQADDLVKRIYQ